MRGLWGNRGTVMPLITREDLRGVKTVTVLIEVQLPTVFLDLPVAVVRIIRASAPWET